jgi:hypothetical protein
MTVTSRFETFNVSREGDEVIYGGITSDRKRVEIRQAADDLDVMLVLVAHVLGKRVGAQPPADRAHAALAATVEPAAEDGVVLSLLSDHNVARAFHLPSDVAIRLSGQIADAARRSRLRAVS